MIRGRIKRTVATNEFIWNADPGLPTSYSVTVVFEMKFEFKTPAWQ